MLLLNEYLLFRYRLSPETFEYTLVYTTYKDVSKKSVVL
jgi:hypothetical protein